MHQRISVCPALSMCVRLQGTNFLLLLLARSFSEQQPRGEVCGVQLVTEHVASLADARHRNQRAQSCRFPGPSLKPSFSLPEGGLGSLLASLVLSADWRRVFITEQSGKCQKLLLFQ